LEKKKVASDVPRNSRRTDRRTRLCGTYREPVTSLNDLSSHGTVCRGSQVAVWHGCSLHHRGDGAIADVLSTRTGTHSAPLGQRISGTQSYREEETDHGTETEAGHPCMHPGSVDRRLRDGRLRGQTPRQNFAAESHGDATGPANRGCSKSFETSSSRRRSSGHERSGERSAAIGSLRIERSESRSCPALPRWFSMIQAQVSTSCLSPDRMARAGVPTIGACRTIEASWVRASRLHYTLAISHVRTAERRRRLWP